MKIMKKFPLVALLASIALLWSCQSGTKQTEEITEVVDPNAITCEGIGPVKLTHTHEDLVAALGAERLTNGTAELDGAEAHVTRVFEGEAEEIIVYWAEKAEPYQTITKIAVANSFGPYQTADGVRVGSTLEELRQLNNFMPVTMKNFYNSSDGFGEILSFNGGDIELNYPCLGGVLDIVKQRGVDVRILDEIKPEPELLSSHRIFSVLDVEVVELSVTK